MKTKLTDACNISEFEGNSTFLSFLHELKTSSFIKLTSGGIVILSIDVLSNAPFKILMISASLCELHPKNACSPIIFTCCGMKIFSINAYFFLVVIISCKLRHHFATVYSYYKKNKHLPKSY